MPKLKPEHKLLLDKPFTAEEVLETIKALKLNKTPGPDRFLSEYYF